MVIFPRAAGVTHDRPVHVPVTLQISNTMCRQGVRTMLKYRAAHPMSTQENIYVKEVCRSIPYLFNATLIVL